jgi:hypothetical protein
MPSTPASLLERLRRPDDAYAWARLVRLHAPTLYGWAGPARDPAERDRRDGLTGKQREALEQGFSVGEPARHEGGQGRRGEARRRTTGSSRKALSSRKGEFGRGPFLGDLKDTQKAAALGVGVHPGGAGQELLREAQP